MNPERQDAMRAFLRASGWSDARLAPLPGDASTRRYVRLSRNGLSAMLMDQPQDTQKPQSPPDATPDERRALGYNAVARLAGADCTRFIAVADFLRARHLSAPTIYAADVNQGFVIIEDFGDDLYADVLSNHGIGAETALYAAAVDALAELHAEAAPHELCRGLALNPYDETALLAEIDLLTQWFFPLALGRPALDEEAEEHRTLWRQVLRRVIESPRVFVHRDYHAQNLFWLPERKDVARAGMIDFQDAVAGAASYDLVSLLEDARRDVSVDLAANMTGRYIAARRQRDAHFRSDAFLAEAAIMAAQRNVKIAGIFARLHRRDGKPRYLAYLPRVWSYLARDLAHPTLDELKRWYDRKIPIEARQQVISGEAT